MIRVERAEAREGRVDDPEVVARPGELVPLDLAGDPRGAGQVARIVATGGLGEMFLGLCERIESFEPTLTLDGLRVASERLR